VRLKELPPMADFAVWVMAAEEALGWEPGTFIAAYSGNRTAATEAALEADPVAVAVMKLLERLPNHELRGTSEDLLERLGEVVSDDVRRTKAWPKAANALSRRLNRLAPLLREAGIELSEDEVGHGKRKVKTLRKIDDGGGEEGSQDDASSDERSASNDGDDSQPSSEASEEADDDDAFDSDFDFGD
jgi:hypothetical protein